MSTVIHNGFLLQNQTLTSLQQFAMDWRGEAETIVKDELAKKMVGECADILDEIAVFGKEKTLKRLEKVYEEGLKKSSLFSSVYSRVRDEVKKEESLSCKVVFIPVKRRIFCLVFAEDSAFVDRFKTMPGIVEYPYWNNTDRPDDISSKEWNRRAKDWEKALPGVGVPSENGFLVQTKTMLPLISIPFALSFLPTFEERVEKWAKERMIEARFDDLADGVTDMMEKVRLYTKARRWVQSEDGQKKLEVEKEDIRQLLLPEITEAQLRDKI